MRDFSLDDSLSQLLIAQRMLSDIFARIVREADDAALDGRPKPQEPEPRLYCRYTSSLETLIGEGKQYGTIYAEPPWPCELSPPLGSFYYRKQMSVEALAALPIRQLAAPSSHLHLWTTDQRLLHAIQVLEAWGFNYAGSLVWIKPHLGAGDHWRVCHEYLLLGTRGNAPFVDYRPRSWLFEAPHSMSPACKPLGIRSLIERVSPGPRLRLFVQRQTEGWTSWGEPFESNYSDDDDDFGKEDEDDTGIEPPVFFQEATADSFTVLPTTDAPNTKTTNRD